MPPSGVIGDADDNETTRGQRRKISSLDVDHRI
jgi:hypothetical protein